MKIYEAWDDLKDWLQREHSLATDEPGTQASPYSRVLDKIEELELHYE